MRSAETVHGFREDCARIPRRCILTSHFEDGNIKMLLTVMEDRATLRSDLSADYGDFKAESDAVRCRSFLFAPLSAENHKALNLGFGQSPMSRTTKSKFLNVMPSGLKDSKCSETVYLPCSPEAKITSVFRFAPYRCDFD